jgi:hypothetical protein
MAKIISVGKLEVGINLIRDTLAFGVLMDTLAGTAVGDAKAKLASEFVTMLDLLMDDIKSMDSGRALTT